MGLKIICSLPGLPATLIEDALERGPRFRTVLNVGVGGVASTDRLDVGAFRGRGQSPGPTDRDPGQSSYTI